MVSRAGLHQCRGVPVTTAAHRDICRCRTTTAAAQKGGKSPEDGICIWGGEGREGDRCPNRSRLECATYVLF